MAHKSVASPIERHLLWQLHSCGEPALLGFWLFKALWRFNLITGAIRGRSQAGKVHRMEAFNSVLGRDYNQTRQTMKWHVLLIHLDAS